MASIQDAKMQKYFQAFADRDYMTCFTLGTELAVSAGDFVVWQVYLISLLRSGPSYTILAPTMGKKFLAATGGDPWLNSLLKLTLGQIDSANVLRQAGNNTQRCQAHYYAGARLLTEGNQSAARKELEACLATKVHDQEYELARADLRQLGVTAAATPAGAAEKTDTGEKKGYFARLFGGWGSAAKAEAASPNVSHLSVSKEQFEQLKKVGASGKAADAAGLPEDLQKIMQLAKTTPGGMVFSSKDLQDPKKRAEIEKKMRERDTTSPEAKAAGEQMRQILQQMQSSGTKVTAAKGQTTRRWHYRLASGSPVGPITDADLKARIADRTIQPTASLSLDGKMWLPAAQVKGIQWP
jgi:hypothetical protein